MCATHRKGKDLAGSVLLDMQGARHVLTSSIYGAAHDLRRKILGACKPSDTPLRSLSYQFVSDLCRYTNDQWRWHTRSTFTQGTCILLYAYMERIFYYTNVSIESCSLMAWITSDQLQAPPRWLHRPQQLQNTFLRPILFSPVLGAKCDKDHCSKYSDQQSFCIECSNHLENI